MALRFRRHIPRDNERTRLKLEQATHIETQRPVGEGSEENWILERDRLGAIIREALLRRQQAEKRLEKEELEKERLEWKQLNEIHQEQVRLETERRRKKRLEKKRQKKEHQEQNPQKRRLREIAQQAALLSSWRQWVGKYRQNLSAEGFTLSGEFWCRPINSEDIDTTVTFKDAKAKKLSDIPSNFPHDPEDSIYINLSWDRIKYEYIWYSQRKENLLDLGFEENIERVFSWPDFYWRHQGSFSSLESKFEVKIWRWPRADSDEGLYYVSPPKDFSPYQILDVAGFDKILLDGPNEQHYREHLDRLPSAQLGETRDPFLQWMRQFTGMASHHLIDRYRGAPPWFRRSGHIPNPAGDPIFDAGIGPLDFLGYPSYTRSLCRNHYNQGHQNYQSRDDMILCSNKADCRKYQNIAWFYDSRHMKTLLEKLERFLRLCLRACYWLDNVLPYRWSRRAARYYSWDWIPPPRSSPQYTYEVSGLLDERPSSAFPDTGSDQNLLSSDYARQNNIVIVPDSNGTSHIKSADGRLIPTIGTAQIFWSFDDSPHEKHLLVFHVLKECVHDVLLGHPFLLETNTTTSNRIKRCTINATSSNSAGAVYDIHAASSLRPGQCTIDGYLAGEAIKTLADTGAQVNIMSLAYAQARNFKLDITGNRGAFRFIDGTEAPSIATVNAIWISSDKKQYSLTFEVLIGSSYDVILGQKHVYGTKALLGKKFDPSASPNSSHATNTMTLDPLSAEPPRTPPVSQNIEGPNIKTPDSDMSKASNVCAVGFKSPFAKASKAAKSLLSKTKKNDNLRPHLSSQAQEEIDRRATEESRQFQVTHSDSSPPSDSRGALQNSSDSTAVASTSNGSASTASIGISTTLNSEDRPPSDTIAVEDLTPEEYQVENAYLPYLNDLLVANSITICNYVCDLASFYMSGQ